MQISCRNDEMEYTPAEAVDGLDISISTGPSEIGENRPPNVKDSDLITKSPVSDFRWSAAIPTFFGLIMERHESWERCRRAARIRCPAF
jgi:hypothetical protein